MLKHGGRRDDESGAGVGFAAGLAVNPSTAPPCGRVVGGALLLGVAAGALLGVLVGTLLLPGLGTVMGGLTGVTLGAGFGLVNGLVLAAVTRRRTDADATVLTGALVSGSLAIAACWRIAPGNPAGVPIGVFFAMLGGVLAPRAVARSRRRSG